MAWRRAWSSYDDITEDLADLGVNVVEYRVDVEAFWQFVAASDYRRRDYYGGGSAPLAVEKWLEHFVSVDLIRPKPDDLCLDIASCASPFADILRATWARRSYRHDRCFPPGICAHGLASDVASLPLRDESVDALTLHCSFEHFESDRDTRFVREADRILKPAGRLCILPLYFNREYSIQTDRDAWGIDPPEFEPDAVICDAEGWGQVHGRFYDPAHFEARILKHLGRLRLTLYRVENHHDVAPDCYLKFAAVFTRA